MVSQWALITIDLCPSSPLKVLPLLGVCSGRTNKIWLGHIHSFKVKLNQAIWRGDKRRLSWECYQFWIDHGGSFHVKQPNGFSFPIQDQFYGYSLTRKALARSKDRFPPPPVPVAKENKEKPNNLPLRRSSRKKDLPGAQEEKEKQQNQSLRRSSRSSRTPTKKDLPPPTPRRSRPPKVSRARVSKSSWSFIIAPPRATLSLTAAQRHTLVNFGLSKRMIDRATDLYFWWRTKIGSAEYRLNKWKLPRNKILRKSGPFVKVALKFHEMIKSCTKLYETKRGMIDSYD
jgi:hypothetical protein